LHSFFWVILLRLNFMWRRFRTICPIFKGGVSWVKFLRTPPMKTEQTVFRNVGI